MYAYVCYEKRKFNLFSCNKIKICYSQNLLDINRQIESYVILDIMFSLKQQQKQRKKKSKTENTAALLAATWQSMYVVSKVVST